MKKILWALLLQVVAIQSAQALCNAGNTVSSALTISSNCDGSGSVPLTLDTNANLIIAPGVTVSNDAGSGRNGDPIKVNSNATAVSITNYGTISTGSQWAITVNSGAVVDNISNFGTIQSGFRRGIVDYGTINTITNVGVILGPFGALSTGADVRALNNLQGSTQGAALYANGNPLQYNIIIRTPSDYGQLRLDANPSGMSFNIYGNAGTTLVTGVAASSIIAGRYLNVLQGVSSLSGVTIGGGGIYSGYNFSLVADATLANAWDLLVVLAGPTTTDTQTSLASNASALQGIYNLQTAIINNGLSYDCALFDDHGLCLSTGGRYSNSNTNTPTSDSAGALVIGAYRLNDHVRLGVYLDQGGVSNSLPNGLHLKQGNPLFGAFAVWQANQDGLGAQIKLAAGYDEGNLSVTRAVVNTSEAGTGSTELSSQAISLVGSYGFEMQGGWLASPYAGLRRSQVKADGYTETDAIDAPLSYGKLKQAATTLQLGVKGATNVSSQLAINGSLGIEHDTNNNQGVYSAGGVDNLTAIVFNSNINKTRPVASLGATLSIGNRQQLAFNLIYREEAFRHGSSTSAYGTYTIGL